jgi:hypothetical protein
MQLLEVEAAVPIATPDGEHWAARLQIHETDPAVEPDMTKWITQLAFRLAD